MIDLTKTIPQLLTEHPPLLQKEKKTCSNPEVPERPPQLTDKAAKPNCELC